MTAQQKDMTRLAAELKSSKAVQARAQEQLAEAQRQALQLQQVAQEMEKSHAAELEVLLPPCRDPLQ